MVSLFPERRFPNYRTAGTRTPEYSPGTFLSGTPGANTTEGLNHKRTLGGCSIKTGLAVCAALLLDPFDMVAVNVEQKTELQPQIVIDKK